MASFAIAIAAGLLAQNDAVTVLGRAIIVLVVCRVAGGVLGWALSAIATDAAGVYGSERPVLSEQSIEASVPAGAVPGGLHADAREIRRAA